MTLLAPCVVEQSIGGSCRKSSKDDHINGARGPPDPLMISMPDPAFVLNSDDSSLLPQHMLVPIAIVETKGPPFSETYFLGLTLRKYSVDIPLVRKRPSFVRMGRLRRSLAEHGISALISYDIL